MEIRILEDLKARLDDPDNLRDFKLVAHSAAGKLEPIGQALAAAGAGAVDATHAWISQAWLRAQGGDATWQAGFDKVVDYAQSKGWVDDKGHIRAHIEWK